MGKGKKWEKADIIKVNDMSMEGYTVEDICKAFQNRTYASISSILRAIDEGKYDEYIYGAKEEISKPQSQELDVVAKLSGEDFKEIMQKASKYDVIINWCFQYKSLNSTDEMFFKTNIANLVKTMEKKRFQEEYDSLMKGE